MILETTINLKNKSKEELILLLNESLGVIEKLQKENEKLKNFKKQVTEIESTNFIKYKNYISKQKVKDKIEKLNDESHAEELENIMIGKNYTITELVQYVLQELIEESEEN